MDVVLSMYWIWEKDGDCLHVKWEYYQEKGRRLLACEMGVLIFWQALAFPWCHMEGNKMNVFGASTSIWSLTLYGAEHFSVKKESQNPKIPVSI
jgi:hypothetical protein